ncbi:MAG: dephospho-CoA kinase [Verrucomicrobiae bacterium]|nr:dephospho-CoA kinase [Verrucomicrobiae bacterium]
MPMISIALTGGVATGKSSATKRLKTIWTDSAAFFSADEAVHELLTTTQIKTKITAVFGERVIDDDGEVSRSQLRQIVFRDESLRRKLEGILHPEVQAMASRAEESALENHKQFLVYEIPLLYEVDSPVTRQKDVVVAASQQTQRQRLSEKRGLETEVIEMIIGAQLPIETKMARADHVIWNDGTESELEEQVILLAELLES